MLDLVEKYRLLIQVLAVIPIAALVQFAGSQVQIEHSLVVCTQLVFLAIQLSCLALIIIY